MTVYQFNKMNVKNFSGGIDQHGSPNNIEETYVEDLVNVDADPQGQLSCRKGYEAFCGYIPIRIFRFNSDTTTGQIILEADKSVDFTYMEEFNVTNSTYVPIIVGGILDAEDIGSSAISGIAGEWQNAKDNYTYIYYSSTKPATKHTGIGFGTGTLTIPSYFASSVAWRTGIIEDACLLGTMTYTNNVSEVVLFDRVSKNKATHASPHNFDFEYNYGGTTALDVFTYYKGADYLGTITATNTITITGATHGLSTANLIIQCYEENVADDRYDQIIPDSITINESNYNIIVTFSTNITGKIVVNKADANTLVNRVYQAGTHELEIDDPDASLIFPVVYTVASGIRTVVLPDYTRYEPLTDTVKFGFILSSSVNFLRFAYTKAQTETNKLVLTANTNVAQTSASNCKLDVWGIKNSQYLSTATYGGNVVEIDKYESAGLEKLVANVGGVFYSNYTIGDYYSTSVSSSPNLIASNTYGIPSSSIYVNLYGLVNGDQYFGPAFQSSTSTHARTKGYIRSINTVDGYLPITSIVYNAGNIDVTLDMGVGFSQNGTIANTYDKLTITQASYSVHNGSFSVVSKSVVGNNLIVKISNSSVTSSDFNETTGAIGGIFTDEITVTSHTLLAGDVINDSLLSELDIAPVVLPTASLSPTKLYVSGNTKDYVLPTAYNIYASRTSNIVPVSSTTNLVVGDVINFGNSDYNFQISYVGFTEIYLNESTIISTSLTPLYIGFQGRWLPISPTYVKGLTYNAEKQRYLDSKEYWNQDIIRSTVAQDNLYMTNYNDIPFKFDGSNLTSLGISKFPGNLFMSVVDVGVVGTAALSPSPVYAKYDNMSNTPAVDKYFIVPDASLFKVGDRIIDKNAPGSPIKYTIKEVQIWDEASEVSKIFTVESLSGSTVATGNIQLVKKLRYYFRYKIVDKNNNIISSAATGLNDYIAEIGSDIANVEIKFAPYPLNISIMDNNEMYIEIFREKTYLAGDFFLVGKMPINTENGRSLCHYYIFKDTTTEEVMSESDSVSNILTKAEVGTQWDKPLFSKYATTINNRLVLANCKDWQSFNLKLVRNNIKISAADIGDIQNSKGIVFTFYHGNYYNLNNLTWPFGVGSFLQNEIIEGWTSGAKGRFIYTDNEVRVKMITSTLFQVGETINGQTSNVKAVIGAGGVDLDKTMYYSNNPNYLAGTKYSFQFTNGTGTGVTLKTVSGISSNASGYYDVTVTVAFPATILNRWVYLYHSTTANRSLKACGWYQIHSITNSPTNTIIRIYDKNNAISTGALTNPPDRLMFIDTTYNIPVFLGTDYNYQYLFGETAVDSSWETLAMFRLANAVNAVMGLDINTTYKRTNNGVFDVPESWLIAEASSTTQGTCVIQSPTQYTPKSIMLEITNTTCSSASSPYKLFVNDEDFSKNVGLTIPSLQKLFPSRIIMSYPNFVEIFNNPSGLSGDYKETLDINPSDGDEITGIIPTIGESLFSASLKEGQLAVFKTNAIYILDVEKGSYVKLDTRGVGCTYPYSIAQTRNGIMFAHKSGMYRLNRDLSISFFHKLEGLWNENVNTGFASVAGRAYGHSAVIDRKYKISVPTGISTHNNEVYVYNYDREEDGRYKEGSWTRYTQHDATGWCNLDDNEYFATIDGQVMKIKDYETVFDYSDNGTAIPVTILDAPRDFGLAGVRKVISSVILHLHNKYQTNFTDLEILAATDLSNTYISLGNMDLVDQSDAKMVTIKFSLPRRKSEYLQMKITGTINNEWFILSGVDFGVGAATEKGIIQQRQLDTNS